PFPQAPFKLIAMAHKHVRQTRETAKKEHQTRWSEHRFLNLGDHTVPYIAHKQYKDKEMEKYKTANMILGETQAAFTDYVEQESVEQNKVFTPHELDELYGAWLEKNAPRMKARLDKSLLPKETVLEIETFLEHSTREELTDATPLENSLSAMNREIVKRFDQDGDFHWTPSKFESSPKVHYFEEEIPFWDNPEVLYRHAMDDVRDGISILLGQMVRFLPEQQKLSGDRKDRTPIVAGSHNEELLKMYKQKRSTLAHEWAKTKTAPADPTDLSRLEVPFTAADAPMYYQYPIAAYYKLPKLLQVLTAARAAFELGHKTVQGYIDSDRNTATKSETPIAEAIAEAKKNIGE
ncbi:MAG: hypothetical protein H7836_17710, partial [Magnetococcus sp. YQC-3]